jgi:aspartate racemase
MSYGRLKPLFGSGLSRLGIVKEESRHEYLAIMEKMREAGAEGIIEGCTEIVMLVQQEHTDIPLFDTTAIHAEAAVLKALEM